MIIQIQHMTRIQIQQVPRIRIQHVTKIQIQHVTRIRIQHVPRIRIQHVTMIRIHDVMRILILHVNRMVLVQGLRQWRRMEGRSGQHYVPTKDTCVLKEAKNTQGINYGCSSNDNMASDFRFQWVKKCYQQLGDWWRFRIITECYNIFQFIVHTLLCFFI